MVNKIGRAKLSTATAAPLLLNARRVMPAVLLLPAPPCASKASAMKSVLTGAPPAPASAPGGSGSNDELLPGALSGTEPKRRGEPGSS
jgi:hypothetical protein